MRISAEELILCATNEGRLYEGQKHLARYSLALNRAGDDVWEAHVRECVIPFLTGPHGGYRDAYRPNGRGLTLSKPDYRSAAIGLRSYYESHVQEA